MKPQKHKALTLDGAPTPKVQNEGDENNTITYQNERGILMSDFNTTALAPVPHTMISQDEAPTLDQWQYETRDGATCDLDLVADTHGPLLYGTIRQNLYPADETFIAGLPLEDVERLRDALTIVLERGARYAGMRVCPSGVAA